MKKITAIFCLLVPLLIMAQTDSIVSGVYNWKEPNGTKQNTSVLFEGKAYNMDWMQMTANTLSSSNMKANKTVVPGNQEQLIIIKSGSLTITIKDSVYSIGANSIALLMPGETFTLQTGNNEPCSYYLVKYRSKQPADLARGKAAGGSFVKDWNKIPFKPHDKGGRRDFFERPTAMGKRLEMHVTTLKQGLKSHDPHTHKAPEIVLITEGNAEMQIGNQLYKGSAGSVFFLASDVLHASQNIGNVNCTYFAFQFE